MKWSTQSNSSPKSKLSIKEMTLFAMLGVIMYCSKLIMEAIPNVHLLGTLTMVYTIVFRKKALIPIYVYVMLNGILCGFDTWWIPYLYVWTILWGITMLLPKNMTKKTARFIYPAVCCIHGLLFGTLYAPCQALMYGFNFEQTISWIIAGLEFDIIHGIGNLIVGTLIIPLSAILKKLTDQNLNKNN